MKVKRTKAVEPAEDDEDYEEQDAEEYEEDSTPKQRREARTRAVDDDDADDDDDDEEELPELSGGWGAYEKNKSESSTFPAEQKLSAEPVLVKFLDTEPLVSYQQHWVERAGKKSFVCLKSSGSSDCPLCDMGNARRTMNVFNLIVFEDDGTPINKILVCGVQLTDNIMAKLTAVQKKLPDYVLTKDYWELSRTGKKSTTNYGVDRVRSRDLKNEYEMDPLTNEALAALRSNKWSKAQAVYRNPRSELEAVMQGEVGDYRKD